MPEDLKSAPARPVKRGSPAARPPAVPTRRRCVRRPAGSGLARAAVRLTLNGTGIRAAVLRNPRAHAHRRGRRPEPQPVRAPVAEPGTPGELRDVLRDWAAAGVTRIVVDGGDGTVRELLGALQAAFGDRPVELAVLPSGKTNALADDLGRGRRLGLDAALGSVRTAVRAPVEVEGGGEGAVRRGFVLGMGVFPDAVRLAQTLHGAGLFGGLAVGAALAGVAARVLCGPASDPWRAGRSMRLERDGAGEAEGARFLLLLSTLERLPLGLLPFGPERPGLKLLEVDAPPRRLLSALPAVLSGRDRPWLQAAGYRRAEVREVRVAGGGPFILDGELFEGGDLRVRSGAPVTFVLP